MKRIIDVLEDLLIKPRDPQRKGPESHQGRWTTLTVPAEVYERAKALLEELKKASPDAFLVYRAMAEPALQFYTPEPDDCIGSVPLYRSPE